MYESSDFLSDLRKDGAAGPGAIKLSPRAKTISRLIRALMMRVIFKKKKRVSEEVKAEVRKALRGRKR